MYTIYGEKYHNDFIRKPFTMTFCSLDAIFQYMKKISHNFSREYGTWFPHRKYNWMGESERQGYNWCSRIQCYDEDDNIYYDFWIYQIDSENGTIYSSGKYTKGEKFCSKRVEEWLEECQMLAKNSKPKFVEE